VRWRCFRSDDDERVFVEGGGAQQVIILRWWRRLRSVKPFFISVATVAADWVCDVFSCNVINVLLLSVQSLAFANATQKAEMTNTAEICPILDRPCCCHRLCLHVILSDYTLTVCHLQ